MTARRIKDDATDALRRALIDAEVITEHNLGEGRMDADDVRDYLRVIGWDVKRLEPGEFDHSLNRRAR
jgi:hypothetical protein